MQKIPQKSRRIVEKLRKINLNYEKQIWVKVWEKLGKKWKNEKKIIKNYEEMLKK